jgi:hypothetical protein
MNKALIIGIIICLAIVSIIVIVVIYRGKTKTGHPFTYNYIRSTGGLFLICEFGKLMSTTNDVSKATPVTFSKCSGEYCLMSGNQNVMISDGGMVSIKGMYTIFIHSLSENTYVGLLGTGATLALSPFGFGPTPDASKANIWNVVTI